MFGKLFFLISLSIVIALTVSYQLKAPKIKFEVRLNNLDNDVKQLYTMIRPGVEIGDIEFFPIKEGFMNSMIRLNDPKSKHPIVVRTFDGKKLENETSTNVDYKKNIHNRDLELAVLEKSSELNITAKLIATFDNGLIMDFINGSDFYIGNYDIETSKEFARRLAKFHQIKLDDLVEKRPIVDEFSEKGPLKVKKIIKEMDEFMEQNKDVIMEYTNNLPSFTHLQKEFKDLHNFMLEHDAYGHICLAHNDLNPGNIMIEKNTGIPYLIDFESANTNYQYFDIGQFFIFEFKRIENHFDTETRQNVFKQIFLKSYYEEWFRSNDTEKPNDDQFDEFIEKEINKVNVNMLQARIYLIQVMLYYMRPSIDMFLNTIEHQMIPMWEDYLKNKDNVLQNYVKLLDKNVTSQVQNVASQDAASHEVTIFLQSAMSICLFVSLGHFAISNFLKF